MICCETCNKVISPKWYRKQIPEIYIRRSTPFSKGKLRNLNAFISKPARGLLNLVRDKHVQDAWRIEGADAKL